MWQPLGPPSTHQSAIWQPGPTERGTFNVLSTCMVTLALCVWTALHLNIPENNKRSEQFWRKVTWLCIGLFAPEMIVVSALQQRYSAAKFGREMESLLRNISPPLKRGKLRHAISRLSKPFTSGRRRPKDKDKADSCEEQCTPKRRYPWTLTHSHYVAMGGFAFDTSNVEQNYLPAGRTRLTLSTRGAAMLASEYVDLLPDMSVDDIRDKSKASGFAKTLVCLQALWFCIETVGRLSSRYPISALELNTLAHALCCLLTYLLWWDKPLDIDQPTLIPQSEAAQTVCAAMCMLSVVGIFKGLDQYGEGVVALQGKGCPKPCAEPEDKSIRGVDELGTIYFNRTLKHSNDIADSVSNESASGQASKNTLIPAESNQPDQPPITLRQFEKYHGFYFQFIFANIRIGKIEVGRKRPNTRIIYAYYISQVKKELRVLLDAADMRRLQLARRAFDENQSWPSLRYGYCPSTSRMYRPYERFNRAIPEYLRIRAPNSPLHKNIDNRIVKLGLVLAGSLYGGVHFIAWEGAFTHRVELMMWRIASGWIVAPIVFAPILLFSPSLLRLSFWEPRIESLKATRQTSEVRGVWTVVGGCATSIILHLLAYILYVLLFLCYLLLVLFFVGYVVARIYLVGECFFNLAHLHRGVYKVPPWSRWFIRLGGG